MTPGSSARGGKTGRWAVQMNFTGTRRGQADRPIHVRIGVPVKAGGTAWACRVQVDGAQRPTLVFGEDPLQSLCLGLEFAGNTLYAQRRSGLQLKLPSGQLVPLHAYFRVREWRRRLVAIAKGHRRRAARRPPNKPLERTGRARRSAPVR
jgi:hypothetical protein